MFQIGVPYHEPSAICHPHNPLSDPLDDFYVDSTENKLLVTKRFGYRWVEVRRDVYKNSPCLEFREI
jgi:hypothetical protein